nr:MAG TPA: hypothetical protein [Caudoviricetes sp.]
MVHFTSEYAHSSKKALCSVERFNHTPFII